MNDFWKAYKELPDKTEEYAIGILKAYKTRLVFVNSIRVILKLKPLKAKVIKETAFNKIDESLDEAHRTI